MDTPILIIHFNRPASTRRQLDALAHVRPTRLWILCDGAREGRHEERELVAEVRSMLDVIPWDCEVRRIYRERNYGLKRNIHEGITEFLNACGCGIILEDDCIPTASFFLIVRICLSAMRTLRKSSRSRATPTSSSTFRWPIRTSFRTTFRAGAGRPGTGHGSTTILN